MATIIVESFEESVNGGDGYDESGWSETVDANCTVDQDSAGPGSLPTGGGSQCLRCESIGAAWGDARTQLDYGSEKSEIYLRVYFYMDSTDMSGNADTIVLIAGPYRLYQIDMKEDSGNYYLSLQGYGITTSKDIQVGLDAWYRIELYYKQETGNNHDGIYDFRVYLGDSTTPIDTDTDTGGDNDDPIRYYRLGLHADNDTESDIYFDLLEVNDGDGWIGPEEEAGGRTTKNTDACPLGESAGMSFRM
jgi:hypothetical protein